jgi:hypothetical protein
MKSTELRSGNLFMYGDAIIECSPLDILELHQIEIAKSDSSKFQPIPLSDEKWRVCLGFKKSNDNLWFLSIPEAKSEIHYEIKPYGNFITLQSSVGEFIPNDIKYIHQIQNLFFSLFGFELERSKTSKASTF